MDNCTVAAVVVTYNRKYLLRENLQALQAQTRKPDKIIVVDNASTDGTDKMIEGEFGSDKNIYHLRLPQNIGGAGGFYEGIKRAYQEGYEWIWLMDDDTIPAVDALEKLLLAHNRLKSQGLSVRLLASRVNWVDGTVHPMNMPTINTKNFDLMFLLTENGCLPVRNVSFVSMMMHRDLVSKYGLPVKSYFIWNDDVEYTARITKNEPGVLVLESVVVHKTKSKHTPVISSSPDRFYFEVRNKIWMLNKSQAWNVDEKVKLGVHLFVSVIRYLKMHGLKGGLYVFRGFRDGILKSPQE